MCRASTYQLTYISRPFKIFETEFCSVTQAVLKILLISVSLALGLQVCIPYPPLGDFLVVTLLGIEPMASHTVQCALPLSYNNSGPFRMLSGDQVVQSMRILGWPQI